MKSNSLSPILFSLALAYIPLQGAEPAAAITDPKEKVSYSIGANIGQSFKQQSVEINNPELFLKGLKDALSGGKTVLTEQEMTEAMNAYKQELMNKRAIKDKAAGEDNKKEGEDFLAANKKKEGVKTLPSGLQYQVITQGKGATPKATDTVETHYRGTLIKGTEFDSSYKRGEPASFQVNGVIKGWTEALQLMKEGDKWKLFIPSELAYGERGAGADIGPNSVLIFDIELISVKK